MILNSLAYAISILNCIAIVVLIMIQNSKDSINLVNKKLEDNPLQIFTGFFLFFQFSFLLLEIKKSEL